MPMTPRDVLNRLVEEGILTPAQITEAEAQPFTDDGRSAYRMVADRLERLGVLTRDQADRVGSNRIDRLRYGSYVLLSRLGKGAMGIVWKARHCSSNQVVAIKLIADSEFGNAETKRRFEREIKSLAKIKHENIVQSYHSDFDKINNENYLVMEYVEGVDLHEFVVRRSNLGQPLTITEICDYAAQAAEGLAHAHERQIVHRDVKPSNLILETHSGRVKVLDFGLARAEGATAMTRSFLGTVETASPESFQETEKVHFPADVYGLGCVLHFLCTGRHVFDSDDNRVLMRHHCETPPPDLKKACPAAPEELCDLFHRMVAKAPVDRPLIRAVADELKRIGQMAQGTARTGLEGLVVAPLTRVPEPSTFEITLDPDALNSEPEPFRANAAEAPAARAIGMEMIIIPRGRFLMGSPNSDDLAFEDEKPQHEVEITRPFLLGKTPVTEGQYQAIAGRKPEQSKDHPVANVSWLDAIQFCNALSKNEGLPKYYADDGGIIDRWALGYRLPTEAEWEYACRAGTTSRYWFGDSSTELREYAWFADNSGKEVWDALAFWRSLTGDIDKKRKDYAEEVRKRGRRRQPVGLKPANPWGLLDMLGNVWEWCGDWWDENFYRSSFSEKTCLQDPFRGEALSSRVVRGGSWCDDAQCARAADRGGDDPAVRFTSLGFRVARALS